MSIMAIIPALLYFSGIADGFPAEEGGNKLIITGKTFIADTEYSLAGAQIKVNGKKFAADKTGYFKVVLKEATFPVWIEARKEGFKTYRTVWNDFSEVRSPFEIRLYPIEHMTEEVVTLGNRALEAATVKEIEPEEVKKIPGAGEDALSSLQYLPGVFSTNDFTSRLYVRGGRPDQNGIYLDGIPIYDPYRLFGLTTLFNPELLDSIMLYPGGFDAQYGDRLSAVIDVENRHGVTDKLLAGSANLSLTNTNLVTEGAIPLKFPASWLFSFRRTYYDLLLEQLEESGSNSYPSFSDIQARLYFEPSGNHRFTSTIIGCREKTDGEWDDEENNDQFDLNDAQRDTVYGIQGESVISEDVIIEYVLSRTHNSQTSSVDYLEGETDYETNLSQNLISTVYTASSKLHYQLGGHTFMTGLSYALSRNDVQFKLLSEDPRFRIPEFLENFGMEQNFRKMGAFVQDAFDIGEKFTVRSGLRWDHSDLSGMSAWSPRLGLSYKPDDRLVFRAAWGIYKQFPSYETLQGDGYFLDLSGIKELKLKPEKAVHYLLGASFDSLNGWKIAVDGYYKKLDDMLQSGREQETILILTPEDETEYFTRERYTFIPENTVEGRALGAETTFTLMEGNDRPYWGMAGLGLSRTEQRSVFYDYRPARYQQRYSVTLMGGYRFSEHWNISFKWRLNDGFPYTPVSKVIRVVEDLDEDGRFEPEEGEWFTYQREDPEHLRYSEHYPAYHRLDMRVNYEVESARVKWLFYVDIINLYNRDNVFSYDYNEDYTEKEEMYGLPLLPSFGMHAYF